MPGDPAEDNRGCFDTGERDRYPAISDAGGGGDSGQPKCVAARVLGQPKSGRSNYALRLVSSTRLCLGLAWAMEVLGDECCISSDLFPFGRCLARPSEGLAISPR